MSTLTKRHALVWSAAAGLALGALGCDKDKPAPAAPAEVATEQAAQALQAPEPQAAAPEAKPSPGAIEPGVIAAQLKRLSDRLGCAQAPSDAQARWCEAAAGFAAAPHSPLPAQSVVLVGLSMPIPIAQDIDPTQVAPGVLGLRVQGEQVQADITHLKARNDANAHHVKGLTVQLRRVWEGKATQLVITDEPTMTWLKARADGADRLLTAHAHGWQSQDRLRLDLRQVQGRWVALWQARQRPDSPEVLHLAIVEPVPMTDRVEISRDVELSQLRDRLRCDEPSGGALEPQTSMCRALDRFAQGQAPAHPAKPERWVGRVFSQEPTAHAVALVRSPSPPDPHGQATLRPLKASASDLEAWQGKTPDKKRLGSLRAAFDALEASGAPASTQTVVQVERSALVLAPELWEGLTATKTYNYLRAHEGQLIMVSHDPMGGRWWVVELRQL